MILNFCFQTPLHPKNAAIGEKAIVLAPIVYVERADAECFHEGENVTFINWGNLRVTKIHRNADGSAAKVDADLNISDTVSLISTLMPRQFCLG